MRSTRPISSTPATPLPLSSAPGAGAVDSAGRVDRVEMRRDDHEPSHSHSSLASSATILKLVPVPTDDGMLRHGKAEAFERLLCPICGRGKFGRQRMSRSESGELCQRIATGLLRHHCDERQNRPGPTGALFASVEASTAVFCGSGQKPKQAWLW